ncbi:DNA repair protein XRCC4-like [Amphibalanus amphitrite]|uniref:DNA repair protein XRCC4-like n=1 Tax=Amphibalanus amphitrite TaxID=1232801 RepID=UPI001C90C54E|nr:DNA repair protein XRCC4-like [Amphibalanus amphitrite]
MCSAAELSKLHTSKISSDEGKVFNYLVHENDAGLLTIYLHSTEDNAISCKAEVTPDMLSILTQQSEEPAALARNLLFAREPSIVWCVETSRADAKVTWKRSLAEGMRLKLGSITLVAHPSASSDMLSICSAALQEETAKTKVAQSKCDALEKENSQLRRLAEEAVKARELLEADLISKFARLLNEKKCKIRALQEVLDERRAEDMNGAGGVGDAVPVSPEPPRSDEDADGPGSGDSDAYDQDTDVDSGGEGAEEAGPSSRAAAPSSRAAPPADDSLELDGDALDDPLPVRPKRPAAEPARPQPPPDKRRLAECDDLLDLV